MLVFSQLMEMLLIIFHHRSNDQNNFNTPQNIFDLKMLMDKYSASSVLTIFTVILLCFNILMKTSWPEVHLLKTSTFITPSQLFQECNALYDFCVLFLMCGSNGHCYIFIHYEELWFCMWCYTAEILLSAGYILVYVHIVKAKTA